MSGEYGPISWHSDLDRVDAPLEETKVHVIDGDHVDSPDFTICGVQIPHWVEGTTFDDGKRKVECRSCYQNFNRKYHADQRTNGVAHRKSQGYAL